MLEGGKDIRCYWHGKDDYQLEITLQKQKQKYLFGHETAIRSFQRYETEFIEALVLTKETPELSLKVVVLGIIIFNGLYDNTVIQEYLTGQYN